MSDGEVSSVLQPYLGSIDGLRRVGQQFWTRGWSLGTSSNYSVVVDQNPLKLLVTASGKDKGHLERNDFVLVDANGKPTEEGQPKSSAETLLHCLAAEYGAKSILHTHSVWTTVLSERFGDQGGIEIGGFEMLKGIQGITTHQTRVWLPIYENSQDIPALASEVRKRFVEPGPTPFFGYLIRRHGMYTWGNDLAEATRHIEIIEFLLECLGREIALK